MKRGAIRFALLTLLASFAAFSPIAVAQTQNQGVSKPPVTGEPAAKEKKASKPAGVPFRGKIEALDKTAMTVTLAGKEKSRVIHVTSSTRFMKDGKPAIFGDLAIGDAAVGQVRKTEDGKEEAMVMRVGEKPAAEAKPEKKKKKEQAPAQQTVPAQNTNSVAAPTAKKGA